MKGGVILFRGSGAAARRYVEADRSRADEYYLGADDAVAEYAVARCVAARSPPPVRLRRMSTRGGWTGSDPETQASRWEPRARPARARRGRRCSRK
jgi:hypothetical protein